MYLVIDLVLPLATSHVLATSSDALVTSSFWIH